MRSREERKVFEISSLGFKARALKYLALASRQSIHNGCVWVLEDRSRRCALLRGGAGAGGGGMPGAATSHVPLLLFLGFGVHDLNDKL